MKLKNFLTVKKIYKGFHVIELINVNNGEECMAFSQFQKALIDTPSARRKEIRPSTLKLAKTAVANFIDYLCEMGVYENKYNALETKLVIKQYPNYLANRIDENFPRLKKTNVALLEYKPKLSEDSSLSAHISYINSFLVQSENLAREQAEILAAKTGVDTSTAYKPLFEEAWQLKNLTNIEKKRLKQSKIGACIRDVGGVKLEPIRILQAISANATQAPNVENVDKAFPIDSVPNLINNTYSKRNKALFAMLACTGLRLSEGLQVRWRDLDIVNREIHVNPATEDELKRALIPENDIKNILSWKGRNNNQVFLISSLEMYMWQTLREYQASDEYQTSPLHDFIFVYIRGEKKGQPLLMALDTENISINPINRAFKSACKKANIKPKKKTGYLEFVPHDLRHGYGTYLLNDCPHLVKIIDEYGEREVVQRGLPLADVNKLMGHEDIGTTKGYAKKSKDRLQDSAVRAHLLLEANGEAGTAIFNEALYYTAKTKQCLATIQNTSEKLKLQEMIKGLIND